MRSVHPSFRYVPAILVATVGLVSTEALAGTVDNFAINVDDTVSDGVPGPGAGNIEVGGNMDVYTFSALAGDEIYFDELSGGCGLKWSLQDPNLDNVFANNLLCSSEPGTIELALDGTYTITVEGSNGTNTGTYSFAIWTVPAAEMFSISIGDTVSDGVPAAGAGNIEQVGAIDFYEFTGNAGQDVYFDELSGGCFLAWTLFDPDDNTIFNNNLLCSAEPGTTTLPTTGTYTIMVRAGGGGDDTGTYSFTIHDVPRDDVFAINLEDVVSDGVPGVGAGNIESTGARDIYTFNATAGEIVYFDELSGGCGLKWSCADPLSNNIFANNLLCSSEPGRTELTETGTYTITVEGSGDDTGTYSITVWDVEPTDSFVIAPDIHVSDGFPGPGAGNIEETGTWDEYSFEGTAGDMLCFEEVSGGCFLRWRLFAPDESVIFNQALCSGQPGQIELDQTGTYLIRVDGANGGDDTGTYEFGLHFSKTADLDGNCHVNVSDLLDLLAAWGTPDGDVDGDGTTDVVDLLMLLSQWG